MSFSVGAFGPMAHYIGATRINAVTGRTVTGNLWNFWVIPNSGKHGSFRWFGSLKNNLPLDFFFLALWRNFSYIIEYNLCHPKNT